MPTRVLSPSFLFGELPSGYSFLAPRSKKERPGRARSFHWGKVGPSSWLPGWEHEDQGPPVLGQDKDGAIDIPQDSSMESSWEFT